MTGRHDANIIISAHSEGMTSSTLITKEVKDIQIVRDTRFGKNMVTVMINGDVVFQYDANFKGPTIIENHILQIQ